MFLVSHSSMRADLNCMNTRATVVLWLVVSAPHPALAWPQVPSYIPKTESECVRAGGKWMKLLAPESFCAPPTTDAGSHCSDSSECQGHCAPIGSGIAEGQRREGQCSKFYDPAASGLRFYLKQGVVHALGVH